MTHAEARLEKNGKGLCRKNDKDLRRVDFPDMLCMYKFLWIRGLPQITEFLCFKKFHI